MHLNIDNIEHNMSNIALGVYKFIIKEQHLHSKQTALLTTLGNVKGLSIYYVVQIWGPERPCCCVVGQNLIWFFEFIASSGFQISTLIIILFFLFQNVYGHFQFSMFD